MNPKIHQSFLAKAIFSQVPRGKPPFSPLNQGFLANSFLILLLSGILLGLFFYSQRFTGTCHKAVHIDLSPWHLPKYAFFSMTRGLIAYVFSLLFSLLWGFWAAKNRTAEKVLIPLLDVFQSIPILGFMPGLVLLLVGLFPHSNIGLELASILMIFTSQAWNMAFGVYHSIRIIPSDKIECAKVYGIRGWRSHLWIELPFTTISLV